MEKKGKVLLIVHDVYQDDNYFPMGTGYLAAVLKKHGADVTVCCQDVFHWSNEELVEKFLKNEEYDIIGISFLSARFRETVLGLCETVNKHKKGAWLVLKTNADIVVLGEAEETIVELLNCKLENGDVSKIKSITYRTGGQIKINERRQPILKLDTIPFPEWSLFPMEKYSSCLKFFGMNEQDKAFGILTTRGCVNRCTFCYRMERALRFRSVENIIEEIKILNSKYGITYFTTYDELFIFSKQRVFDFYVKEK